MTATVLSFVWLGHEIVCRRWRAGLGPFERLHAAVAIGAALWIASVWLPALLHELDRPAMLVRSALVFGAALASFLTRKHAPLDLQRQARADLWLPLLPVAMWIVFIGWRSAIVPPLSHDALAYHLPRAVFWIREHAFTYIDLPIDFRVRTLPANYELLLADVMLLAKGDAWTEWIGLFFYIAFVIAAAGLSERWWPRAKEATIAVALLSASMPVLLLHAGADKNDVMTAFFMLSALAWTGRWMSNGDIGALMLCGVTTIAAAGTKPQGLILGAVLLPIVVWTFIREWRAGRVGPRKAAAVLAVSFAAVLLLGGAFYANRMLHQSARDVAERRSFVRYDDWANLWQGPWVLVTAPFARSPARIYVPGAPAPWFWRRYEIYFSHLGVPFAICVLTLPFAIAFFRRFENARERLAMSAAALATLLLMLPVRDVPMPHGIYAIALPRYVMFIGPVVFALTIAPAMMLLADRALRYAVAALACFAVWFTYQAVDNAWNDVFVPIDYVMAAREHPGIRMIPFNPFRAASMADRVVGPRETIYFDAGYSAWIHPAFGRDLQRPVVFLDRPVVPPEARWVVIDRHFATVWQHPQLRDLSQASLVARGKPTARDVQLVRQLEHDPRFKIIYLNRPANQAVFKRIR